MDQCTARHSLLQLMTFSDCRANSFLFNINLFFMPFWKLFLTNRQKDKKKCTFTYCHNNYYWDDLVQEFEKLLWTKKSWNNDKFYIFFYIGLLQTKKRISTHRFSQVVSIKKKIFCEKKNMFASKTYLLQLNLQVCKMCNFAYLYFKKYIIEKLWSQFQVNLLL